MAITLTLSNIQLQELFYRWRQGVQPWSEFLDSKKFSTPKSLPPVGRRIVTNVQKFRSNYIFVFMCILGFTVLTSPVLLLVIAFGLGASYAVFIHNQDRKLSLMGHEITHNQQIAAVGMSSVFFLWLFGVGSVVFWIIGVSFALILSHASFFTCEDEYRTAELQATVVV